MICFAWLGFPQYAARCVGAFARATKSKVLVVATRPAVPVRGMEELCGCEVKWVDENAIGGWDDVVGGERPKLIFTSGWGSSLFNRFRDEVRMSGGRAIAMCDNNFQLTLKEVVKSIRFRLAFSKKYDGYFVVGKSGRRLLKFYGVDDALIKDGLYSADKTIFRNGSPLEERDRRIVYVGQFCDRKNVLAMCEAFVRANQKREWILEMCGCGPQRERLPIDENIVVHDFVQPEELSVIYRRSRAFCLASKEEHWGLVVHEAALSGCVLLLSESIGAKDDLLQGNGFSFNPFDLGAMTEAFSRVMRMSAADFERAQDVSLRLANGFSLEKFVSSAKRFECDFGARR